MAVICPECDSPLDLDPDEVEEGEVVQCDECGVEVEVVSTDPLELMAIEDEGYDEEERLQIDDEEE
ncbi:MAG TPA: hypothetical protein VGC07_02955 [Granulicella sp.]